MTCERHYTPEAVAEMQTIALAVKLRQRIAATRKHYSNPMQYPQEGYVVQGRLAMLKSFDAWLDEAVCQCDNPPEAITAADYTVGMME